MYRPGGLSETMSMKRMAFLCCGVILLAGTQGCDNRAEEA